MRTILAAMLLCASAGKIFAQGVAFNAPFSAHSLEANVNVNSGTGVELFRVAESFAYYYRGKYVTGTTGVQFSEMTTDVVLQGAWYPLRFSKFRAGFGVLYHYGRFQNVEFEHDFFLGASAAYHPFKYFYLNADVFGSIKITDIPSLPREFSRIRDNGLALSLKLGSIIARRFKIEASASSYELFRYHLFFHPTYALSLTYFFDAGFYAGFTAGVRYSDHFTLTSHVDNYFGVATFGITL